MTEPLTPARERLQNMVRTDPSNMTVHSAPEVHDTLDAYRTEAIAKAIGQLRAVPVQCTALRGPVWYGQGWADAISTLEDIADYSVPDYEEYPGELVRLRALALQLRALARRSNWDRVMQVLHNHSAAESTARAEVAEKASASTAPTATPQPEADDEPEPETAGARAAKEIQALHDPSCIGYVIGVDRLQLILNPATPAEWATWQKRLALIASRTTYRGSVATGHGTWNGVPVTVLCHLDRINAARTAPTSHADRQSYLLSIITAQGGKWATGRVDGHYRQQGWRVARSACRGDLQALEAAGHLTEHGPVDGTYYRLNTPTGGQS